MQPHAVLVNAARGRVCDEAALIEALEAGRIAGAGLDVFADEPRVPERLRALRNAVLAPHAADATFETRARMTRAYADGLLAAARLNQKVQSEPNGMILSVRSVLAWGKVAGQRPNPLYDPRHEHDACGLGFVAPLGRRDAATSSSSRRSQVLRSLDHRGATGSDPDTGDGAGLMLQLPDAFLRRVARAELERRAAAARATTPSRMAFLPRDPGAAPALRGAVRAHRREEGQRPLGWRDVPVDSDAIGELARESEPLDAPARDRAAGGRRARGVRAQALRDPPPRREGRRGAASPRRRSRIASCSARTLIYKGLLRARQLDRFYPDLREPDFATAIALVHSRFSTNTLGTWDLAHPFNYLAHNGEINTVRGNASGCTRASRSCARRCSATTCRSSSRSSTSAGPTRPRSTRCFELLVRGGPLAGARRWRC